LLRLPASDHELEQQVGVDVARNLREYRAVRAGFNGSGVADNNRLIERHSSKYGAYWKSYDFAGNTGRQNLFDHPLGPGGRKSDFQHDGGEIIFSLPNGLHGYLLVDAGGRRIDVAPIGIVKDVRQKGAAVRNGVSCMGCHVHGIIEKDDQVRKHAERNPGAFSREEHGDILGLYPPTQRFQDLVRQDVKRYTAALEKTGVPSGNTDPIVALAARYEWDLDVALAAAEVGLSTTEFQKRLTESKSAEIARLFGPLRTQGGTVRREVFEKNFNELILALGLVEKSTDPVINSIGMKFKRIPPGPYSVGSAREEPGREEGETLRSVQITKVYYIGVHEVTQEQYTKVVGTNPSFFCTGGGGSALVRNEDTRQFPVESLSWVQARDFCALLSALPEEKAAGRSYRLPLETEWEIACRAGASTMFPYGDDVTRLSEFAWYDKNAGDTPHPVGMRKPNAWGLYDMHGNVREWCADHWDGVGHLPLRAQRGGSWLDPPGQCRAAYRGRSLEKFGGAGGKNFGLRAVMELATPSVSSHR
jgi:formylglycine-generating enzyme required for sulfatase activity